MPPKIRVLFSIGTMGGGGAERQVVEILKRLDRQRFQPFLYLSSRTGPLLAEVPIDVPVAAYYDEFGATRAGQLLARGRMGLPFRWRSLARKLEEWQIDVIYERTFAATIDTAGAALLRPTPRIAAAVADPRTEVEINGRWRAPLRHRLGRWAYRSANRVLANSEGLRLRMIEEFQLLAERVEVLPNLLDLHALEQRAGEFPVSLDPSKFHLLTVGRIDANKGQALVLTALAEHTSGEQRKQLQWHVLGEGPDRDLLQRRAQDAGLGDCVRWHGFIANPAPWYKAADLLVFPSYTEGMPNVLMEAAACQLPILSTDCPSGPREILAEGAAGVLVPVGDARALAQQIQTARNHQTAWHDRAKLAYQLMKERHEPRNVMVGLESLFGELATPR